MTVYGPGPDRIRTGPGSGSCSGSFVGVSQRRLGVVVNTYTTCCHLLQTITWLPGLTDELVSSIAALSEFTKHF